MEYIACYYTQSLRMLRLEIHKTFPGFTLDLALDAPEEKIIVLFGPSGSGKSLTLGALAGWYAPDAGRIQVGDRLFFDAKRNVNLSPQERRVGMVRQDLALFPHLTAAENIAYGLFRENSQTRATAVREFLDLMELDGLGSHKPAQLSGGQQQRVALARALAIRPTVLLLDEPFSALDQPTRVELRNQVRKLQQRLKTSMLFVTHDLSEAHLMADYLAIVEAGRVVQFDKPDQVERAPANSRIAGIVGYRNILPATVIDANGIRIGEREIETDTKGFARNAQVFVCIRQERVTLVRRDFDPNQLPNVIEGNVMRDESDGSNVVLWFRALGARLQPQQEYDLQIDVPQYVYERLRLASERHWFVSLKPDLMHLVAA